MGVDAMLIGVRVRKFMFISTKSCYRSICNHPFFVAMLCFFIFLHRSFPIMFSLFVSVSPVLVCTAVLLGTLLSFGQPNTTEIEKGDKVTHEVASLKSSIVENATVVERDGSFLVESYLGNKSDVADNLAEVAERVDNKLSVEDEYGGSGDSVPLSDESSQGIQRNKVADEMERKFDHSNREDQKEIHGEELGVKRLLSDGEIVEGQYSLLEEEGLKYAEAEDDESNLTCIDKGELLPSSSWNSKGEENEGSDEDGDESSDDGSDGAESSSPDASMTDIMPMLDELHPLLDIDAPQPAHRTHDRSDDGSESSHKSDESSDGSDEDIEKQAEEEDGDDEEEEEEVPEGNEDGSKSAITWTETDQKNLMELGTIETERNRRLESLIARRRLRKRMKLMAEKNLIDLDGADLPFNVPTISTVRQNPFDLPYDSYESMGLPPIPGSAPSILQPRRNPFDLPYDSNEEKPDLKGDSFQQEFAAFQQRDTLQQRETSQQREAFFRRHESFCAGPSSLGGLKREKHGSRFKPYFIPEGIAFDGMNYHTLHRQSSELSESKASSVPDTESVSSAVEDEDKKVSEQDVSRETEFITNTENTSDNVEHESQSSDIESLDAEQADKRDVLQEEVEITLGDVEGQPEIVLSLSVTGRTDALVDLTSNQIDLNTEPFEDVCSCRSSLSSLSEDERISDVRKELSSRLELQSEQAEESHISTQVSLPESDFHFKNEGVDDHQHREPVYDSSPPAIEKYLSFSSISSDIQAEIAEIGSPSVAVGSVVPESELHGESVDMVLSSQMAKIREQDVATSGVMSDYGKQDRQATVDPNPVDSSSSSRNTIKTDGHVNSDPVFDHDSVDASSIHSGTESINGSLAHELDKAGTNHHVAEIPPAVHEDVVEKLDAPAFKTSADSAPGEQQPSTLVEHVSALTYASTSEIEPAKEPVLAEDEIHQLEKDDIQSSSSLDYESIADDMTPRDRSFQFDLGQQVQLSSVGVCHDEKNPDATERSEMTNINNQNESSNDLRLCTPEKQQPPVMVEQLSEVHHNFHSSEPEHVEEHSSKKEDVRQFEPGQVQTSSSHVKVDDGNLQNADAELTSSVSGHIDGPSEEKVQAILGKNSSDESTGEPTSYESQAESRGEVSKASTLPLGEIHDPTRLTSVTSDAASIQSECPEYKSPTGEEDMKETIFDNIVYEDHSEASEQFNTSAGTSIFHDTVQNNRLESDEIQEIDEGLLSELDSVGDFNVKEVIGESVPMEQFSGESSKMETEFTSLTGNSNLTESNPELPVLEAKSVSDIELAFKQLREGADVEEVFLPSMIEDQLRTPADPNSNIAIVEARSLEDIDIALKGGSEVDHSDWLNQPELNQLELKESLSEVETNEVVSPKKNESSSMEAVIAESITVAAGDPKTEFEEMSGKASMGESETS